MTVLVSKKSGAWATEGVFGSASFAVSSITAVIKTFIVVGDARTSILKNDRIGVTGSVSSDGVYTVTNADPTFLDGNTTFLVTEAIPANETTGFAYFTKAPETTGETPDVVTNGAPWMLATVPVGETLVENQGVVTDNYGTITLNLFYVSTNKIGGIIAVNGAFIYDNYGTVTENDGVIMESGGLVVTNNSWIGLHDTGYIITTNANGGCVQQNNGTVTNNASGGVVQDNNGIVTTNASGGIVVDNHSPGTVGTNNGYIVSGTGANIETAAIVSKKGYLKS